MDAMQRLAEMNRRRQSFKSKLETAGLDTDRLQRDLHQTAEQAAKFAGAVLEAATSQAVYDHLVNFPTGITSPSLPVPARAVHHGIVHAAGTFVQWDIVEALKLCRDILEDVNAHEEAASLQTWIDKWEALP